MADHLPDSIAEKSYSISFISYQGKRGIETDLNMFPVKTFKRDSSSLEYLIHSLNYKFAYLDFQSLTVEGKNSLNTLNMYPTIEMFNRAKWSEIYDGVFFIDTMEPDVWKHFSIKDEEYFRSMLYK
jgi:erythromycin esterase-like protein